MPDSSPMTAPARAAHGDGRRWPRRMSAPPTLDAARRARRVPAPASGLAAMRRMADAFALRSSRIPRPES